MKHCTREQLITFEQSIRELWEAGELNCLLHLCGGNEGQLIDIFEGINPGDWVFSTHRSHYHFLLAGGAPEVLRQRIIEGDSMFIFDKALNFVSSSILAGTCAMAAGVAAAIKERGGSERVFCFLGDGAEDEGNFYEAVCFVQGRNLPCRFIIEDNNRSVDTDKPSRRGSDFHMAWPSCVTRYHYTPTFPHAGSGAAPGSITFKSQENPRLCAR